MYYVLIIGYYNKPRFSFMFCETNTLLNQYQITISDCITTKSLKTLSKHFNILFCSSFERTQFLQATPSPQFQAVWLATSDNG